VNIDDELTILLTLKDRAEYTTRWITYANSIAFPFRVLIADGSSDDSVAHVLSDRARFPNVIYDYVRYPQDKTYADYNAKIVDALNRVHTPFVALADNDDFFLVDCLRESVRFLSEHSEYVACGGQGALLWITESAAGTSKDSLYGNNVAWKCSLADHSIDADAARDRLQALAIGDDAVVEYYDVKRTVELRRQFRIVQDLNLHDPFLVEWLILYLTSIAGKAKRLGRLYLVRQKDSPGSAGGAHAEKFGNWFGRMLLETWSEDFTKFVSVLSASLAETDGIPLADAKNHIFKTYRMSIAPQLLSDLIEEPTVSPLMPVVVTTVRRLVGLSEESFLKRLARKIYRRVNLISLHSVYGTRLLSVRVQNAGNDMKSILTFLGRGPHQR